MSCGVCLINICEVLGCFQVYGDPKKYYYCSIIKTNNTANNLGEPGKIQFD